MHRAETLPPSADSLVEAAEAGWGAGAVTAGVPGPRGTETGVLGSLWVESRTGRAMEEPELGFRGRGVAPGRWGRLSGQGRCLEQSQEDLRLAQVGGGGLLVLSH